MKNKHISLIYKKLDGTISEKESSRLDKYLSKDAKHLEEYNLIKNLFEELKKTPQRELPDNFSKTLKSRLVEYNINKKDKKIYHLPILQTAVALAIVIMVVFTATDHFSAIQNSNSTQEYGTVVSDDSSSDINNEENNFQADLKNEKSEKLTRAVAPQNTTITMNGSAEAIFSYAINENLPIINCTPGVFEILAENPQNGSLAYPINRYEELKELVKDYIISIENEENLQAETFIINEEK